MAHKSLVSAVYIRSTSTKQDFTLYHIEVNTSGGRQWIVKRRYSEFTALHADMAQELGCAVPFDLPPKNSWKPSSWFRSSNEAVMVEERKTGLEFFLRSLLNAKDAKFRSSRALADFLQVPRINASTSITETEFTPSSWADELQAQLAVAREIRAEFSKRDALLSNPTASVTTSEIRKQSVDAKIKLASLVQSTSTLANGLTTLGKQGMIEAELRRRTDALVKLQDEVALLGKMAMASKRATTSSIPPAKEAASQDVSTARAELLGATNKATRSGRVLGKPKQAEETDQTRALDNRGLLQLQQTQMDDQDSRLDAISAVLRRQHMIAGAIHAELSEQNEILGDLDNQVDRTSSNLANANKKLRKLG